MQAHSPLYYWCHKQELNPPTKEFIIPPGWPLFGSPSSREILQHRCDLFTWNPSLAPHELLDKVFSTSLAYKVFGFMTPGNSLVSFIATVHRCSRHYGSFVVLWTTLGISWIHTFAWPALSDWNTPFQLHLPNSSISPNSAQNKTKQNKTLKTWCSRPSHGLD